MLRREMSVKFYQKLLTCFVLLFQTSFCNASPLSIAVIGGGPAGLSAAIQASLLGADVTVIEKRETYTRNNILFLHATSLDSFDQWDVEIPQVEILSLQGQKRGFVLIKDLEEALRKRASDLGIKIIHGTFEDFESAEKSIAITTAPKVLYKSYHCIDTLTKQYC